VLELLASAFAQYGLRHAALVASLSRAGEAAAVPYEAADASADAQAFCYSAAQRCRPLLPPSSAHATAMRVVAHLLRSFHAAAFASILSEEKADAERARCAYSAPSAS